ncbi:unnamed protein product [Parajaminaea phylloscopi]
MSDSREPATNSPKYREVKVSVPFPSAANPVIHLAGILAQHEPLDASPTGSQNDVSGHRQARPLALIMHGVLCHKNQSYHPLLARSLPIDSFRFDFRGNAESPLLPDQEWDMASFGSDVQDINAVLDYLGAQYGYRCDLLAGHSRGSLVGWKWFAETYDTNGQLKSPASNPHLPSSPPLWASLGGRWRMERIHDRDKIYAPSFEEQGFYEWKVDVNRKAVSVRIYPASVQAFSEHPAGDHARGFPASTPCLLIHGTEDETVPCADVGYYLNSLTSRPDRVRSAAALVQRSEGPLTQMHLVEGGNHMLRGKYQEVVDSITTWYRSHRQAQTSSASPGLPASGDQLALEAKQEKDVMERSWQDSNVHVRGGSADTSKL